MPFIHQPRRIIKGRAKCLGGRRRAGQIASLQHLLDPRSDPGEQAGFAERVAAGMPHGTFYRHVQLALLRQSGNPERLGHHGVQLVQIGNVIDKALRFAGVQKADGWGIACGQNRGFGQAVQTGGGR